MKYAALSTANPFVGFKGTPPWFKTNESFLTEEPAFLRQERDKETIYNLFSCWLIINTKKTKLSIMSTYQRFHCSNDN